nr:reverse transcriptase domain-containing protein [Tanacetum cinerariifolium]
MNTTSRENTSKTNDKLADQISTLVDIFARKVITPTPVKAVEESCVTCGGNHAYYNYDATSSNQSSVCVAMGTCNQVAPQNRASNYMALPGFAPVQNNSQNRFNQNQGQGNNFNRGNNFHNNQSFQVPNQGFQNQPFQVPNNQVQQGFSNEFVSYKKANDQMIRNMQSQINSLKGEFKNEIKNTMKTQQTVLMNQQNAFQNNLQNMLSGFFQNQSLTLGTLPSNTIPNPKGEMKAITTRSGVAYEGPLIPTNPSPKKVVERETKETTDKEQTNFQGSTAHIQPSVTPILEPDVPKTLPKPNISYPSRLSDQKLRKKATNQMEKFFQIFQDLHFDISFADALLLMLKFAFTIKSLLANKDKLFELAKISLNENCSAMLLKKFLEKLGDPGKFLIPCDIPGMDVCHALADLGASINLMPLFIWKKLSLPELTPTRMALELADRSITRPKGVAEDVFVKVGKFHFLTDFVVVDFEADPWTTRYSSTYDDLLRNQIDIIDVAKEEKEIEAYLKDESISSEINHDDCDSEGDICLIEKLLNNDPFQLLLMDLKQGEAVKAKSSIKEPPELELKDLPSHLEYVFLEGVDKLPVIIAKDLKDNEKEALLKVLKSHKRAIAWKITDVKGTDPRFCTHKILMKEDYKPAVQSQRWVNPKIHEVIKKEVIKLLDTGMIYLISDSRWVSPIHCVPKKDGKTVVENENNELIPTRKQVAKPRLIRWVLLFQEFDIIIRDKKGTENLAADHLSRLENPHKDVFENKDINENFPLETLGKISSGSTSWFADFANYHARTFIVKGMSSQQKKKFFKDVKHYFWDDPYLFGYVRIISFDVWVTHHLATAYHPQTSGQVEASNQGLKRILKRTVGENCASSSEKLKDALWAFKTAYKTPIRCTPYTLVYGKSCHLPIELEHKAYWALKHVNFDLKTAGDHQTFQLNELNELHGQAYENYLIYKEKTRKLHDSKIKNRIFNVGDRGFLFNSRLKIFSGKLKTRWSGPFMITKFFLYGTVELSQPDGPNFKVNGHRVKHYFGGDIPQLVVPDLQTFPMDK